MKCKITNKLKLKLPDILIKATAGNGEGKGTGKGPRGADDVA